MMNRYRQTEWMHKTNVYEVNLRQYTLEGTFAAFSKHLTRLKDMGVEILWFMPITPISLKGRKGALGSYYACSSYTKVNREYGSMEDFKQIVAFAHENDMKVIIDWVANHTGCDHEWTISNPDFYKRNHIGEFYDAHGWDDVIDLDYQNDEMRMQMINSMKYWVEECDIDGFRCDMAMLTPVDFWHQARKLLSSTKTLFWLAELDVMDNPDYMEVFDSCYTWRWMNATKDFRNNGSREIYHLKSVLHEYSQKSPLNTLPAWFTSNHDENSWNGTEYEKYGEMAIPLAVFNTLWKGIPLLYSGQELPNVRRLEFFDKDPIIWEGEVILHDFYKKLFEFRKKNQTFSDDFKNTFCYQKANSVEHHVMSFVRHYKSSTILVLLNLSEYPLNNVEVHCEELHGVHKELFSSMTQVFNNTRHYFHFQPWSYQVWYK